MSVAAAPEPAKAEESEKASAGPMSLRELYRQARTDTAKPTPEAQLRWLFWHAKAVGRVEVARAVLKRIESRDWEIHSRAMGYMPGTAQHQALIDSRPQSDLRRAQEYLDEQVAFEQACRSVMDLLARAPIVAIGGGRR